MIAGGNSRTAAQAAAARLSQVSQSLPPGIIAEPVLDRSVLVNATIRTVATNLTEGALLVIAVLFLLLGNIRAAAITALVIPLSFLFAVIGMNRFGISGNLMSLGALDFGILVDGAVIVIEATLLMLGQRRQELGRPLTAMERLGVAMQAARKMVRPAAFGQLIILLVFAPILTLEGVEGKTFQPMAATFMLALAGAFIFSFTFVPAMAALFVREPKSVPEIDEGHHETRVIEMSEALLAQIAKRDNPQTVIGAYKQRLTALGALEGQTLVALDGVKDPGNLGTILRTADSTGAGGVILVGECCDPFSIEAVRASMGSLFAMPIARATLGELAAFKQERGAQLVGASLTGRSLEDAWTPSARAVLFMGNEQSGLSAEMEAACDVLVKLPMRGRADSLNLGVATGVMLYDLWRRRGYDGARA